MIYIIGDSYILHLLACLDCGLARGHTCIISIFSGHAQVHNESYHVLNVSTSIRFKHNYFARSIQRLTERKPWIKMCLQSKVNPLLSK